METEAKSYEDDAYFTWDVGVFDVVFESDSKIVVDVLNGIGEPPVAIDNIVVGIRNKLQDFRHVSISHVKKNGPTYLLVQYDKKR